MAYISYIELWQSEFDNIVTIRHKVQDLNTSQLKLEVHDSCIKDGKLTTNSKPSDDADVINKDYLDQKNNKKNCHIFYIENDYNEYKLQNYKQSVEEVLVERAAETRTQILYDKGLYDNYANADEVLEDFLFVLRRRIGLEEVKYVFHWFYS